MKLLIIVTLLLSVVFCINALKCVPCDPTKCDTTGLSKCRYGTGKDICQCCDICAKGPGEPCGGLWNQAGSCGRNLYCHPKKGDSQLPGKCLRRRPK